MGKDVSEKIKRGLQKKVDDLMALYKKVWGRIPVDVKQLVQCLEKTINREIDFYGYYHTEDYYKIGKAAMFPHCENISDINNYPMPHIIVFGHRDLNQQRIDTGHEIIHFLLIDLEYELQILPRERVPLYSKEAEDICDELGVCLVCPPDEVRRFLCSQMEQGKLPKFAILKKMAKNFEVPVIDLLKMLKSRFNNQKIEDIFLQLQS